MATYTQPQALTDEEIERERARRNQALRAEHPAFAEQDQHGRYPGDRAGDVAGSANVSQGQGGRFPQDVNQIPVSHHARNVGQAASEGEAKVASEATREWFVNRGVETMHEQTMQKMAEGMDPVNPTPEQRKLMRARTRRVSKAANRIEEAREHQARLLASL